ncbi:MAG: glucosamine-6-phosphate deaminase [Kiritimatiellae bacterium]|jgi:glucosamine-6-phosphate deaminase|nr:glucosamine-6-phosphate deaminase [Kiritimatiellia bacterium]
MEIVIQSTPEVASRLAAQHIARQIREKPDSVLGLATGGTPRMLYRELIRLHREEGLDFSQVTTFNLDEYLGLPPEHPQSYHQYMHENFFQFVDISSSRMHLPDGMTRDVAGFCADYEERIREAGGLDLQILGIGTDGHVGFNEPTSSLTSRTRIKTLTQQTLADNARFFKHKEAQPHHVITMGIGTIMEARRILLLAFGQRKAEAVASAVEGPLTAMVPASILQLHPTAHVFLDEPAAEDLTKADYYRWVYAQKPDWQA